MDILSSYKLLSGCRIGDEKLTEEALGQGADVNAQNSNGFSAIMIASEFGHSRCVNMLLKKGANVDVQSPQGATALMLACQDGHSQCVELLLNEGANAEVQHQNALNALMTACQNGHSKCVELLLKYGADANFVNRTGATALMSACLSGYVTCVELLLQNGADVNLQSNIGQTALQLACGANRLRCVELLLGNGPATTNSINLASEHGNTAMALTCSEGAPRIAHLLIDAKADMYVGQHCASDALLHHPKKALDGQLSRGMKQIPYSSSYDRQLTGFVLMCGGYDLKRARESIGHLREDYQRTHALLEERQSELLAVLDTDVLVDTRLHRKENGLYHEPLEQVLAYCGMLLKPEMLNEHEDDKKKGGRVMLTGSFEALKMAFDWHFARICRVCDATSNASMKQCSCHVVRYCSTACQTKDWPWHKTEHKRIMKNRKQQV